MMFVVSVLVWCLLCQFENRRLGQSVVLLFVSVSLLFVRHFGVSAWFLKCAKHIGCHSDVVQRIIYRMWQI